jgi:hypothetical protein
VKQWIVLVLLLAFGSGSALKAQNLNGFWKGKLSMASGCFPDNNIELQLYASSNLLSGDSYHYWDTDNYVKKTFQGTYSPESRELVIQEGSVTTFKIRPDCKVCIKRYELTYSRSGNVETLTGSWTGYIRGTGVSCDVGNIVLTRTKESAFKEIPEIGVDTGRIRLDFYDNSIIDGDSISVVVNKRVVLSHQRLSLKPITTYVEVDLLNEFQEVEMVAENLGSIPPNTALLIITAGEHRYQLFLSSTETKSAKVRFVYDPVRRGRLNPDQ